MLVSCHEAALLSFREDVFACQLTGSPHWRANWWGRVVKECEREGARWSGWRGVTRWHFCDSDEKIDRRIVSAVKHDTLLAQQPCAFQVITKMQKARRLKKRYRVRWVHKWNLPLKTCFLAFSKSKKAFESGDSAWKAKIELDQVATQVQTFVCRSNRASECSYWSLGLFGHLDKFNQYPKVQLLKNLRCFPSFFTRRWRPCLQSGPWRCYTT